MSPFLTGDVVQHNTGGPYMLVFTCDDDGVRCLWATEGVGPTPYIKTETYPVNDVQLVLSARAATAVPP